MIFVHSVWDDFCKRLHTHDVHSIPACEVASAMRHYLVLKHDVETNVRRAYKMALIEKKYGHCGSYYVQAYLLEDPKNVEILKKMQQMGHEISYHYDVMDSNKGDLKKAIDEFEHNRCLFEEHGFPVTTVCQHGNPVVERIGYHSNRDFFRSEHVKAMYPGISDIMVNYKENIQTDYLYFSDAGHHFQLICDPINNDITNSDHCNISFEGFDGIHDYICQGPCFISVHPHRWATSAVQYHVRSTIFKVIKRLAKLFMNVPIFKRIMSRYYHLAKKI